MMRLAVGSLVASLCLVASTAWAQSNIYVGAAVGPSFFFDQEIEDGGVDFDIEYDQPGFVFAGQLGYQIAINMRAEAEISYASADGDVTTSVLGIDLAEDSIETSVFAGTAGLFLDFWPINTFIPYVGGGLGSSLVNVDAEGEDDQNQGAFLVFGEAGLPFQLTPELSIVPAVRFNWILTEEDGDDLFADNLYPTEL